jgi:hypothetical protein
MTGFPGYAGGDQVGQRCGCGRYVAWPRTQVGHGAPRCCCCCMQPAEHCTSEPTDQPADAADCE